MLVCHHCHSVMEVAENGVGVRWDKDHVRPGDLYECSKCLVKIILAENNSVVDKNHDIKTIQMGGEL